MIRKLVDATVTFNSNFDSDLIFEVYQKATENFTDEEKEEFPISEVKYICTYKYSDDSVEYEIHLKE